MIQYSQYYIIISYYYVNRDYVSQRNTYKSFSFLIGYRMLERRQGYKRGDRVKLCKTCVIYYKR